MKSWKSDRVKLKDDNKAATSGEVLRAPLAIDTEVGGAGKPNGSNRWTRKTRPVNTLAINATRTVVEKRNTRMIEDATVEAAITRCK